MGSRRLTLIVLGAQAAAFWPVWPWYVRRALDPSDEPWALLALATAVGLSVLPAPGRSAPPSSFVTPAVLTAAYAVLFPFVPPLGRALLAFAATSATLTRLGDGRALHPARLALFALATPLLPSLQFVAGYPLRVAAGDAAALLLRMSGLPVVREGALLGMGELTVAIEAPCSGVRMLWAGLYLAAILSWRLPPLPALGCLGLAALAVVVGNALRSAALFYPESGLLALPAGAHDAVGLAVFALIAASVAAVTRSLEARPCAR